MFVPQVFVCEKSLPSAPAKAMFASSGLLLLVFVTVINFTSLTFPTGWLPKERAAGTTLRTVPVAVNAVACGLAGSESLTAIAAFLAPLAVGLNVTMAVQVPPGTNAAPQLFVTLKSPASRPAAYTLFMFRVVAPLLVILTLSGFCALKCQPVAS